MLFVVNDTHFFLSHRLPLALAARSAGYDVHVVTPPDRHAARLLEHGLPHHPIPLTRSKRRPAAEARSVLALYRLYRRLQPALVHHVTIKPVIYGGLAARLARVPAVVNAVSGLGFVFIARGPRAAAARAAILRAYRLALGHPNSRTIFQNEDDRGLFVRAGAVDRRRTVLIRGSGVDLVAFAPAPAPPGVPIVVFPSRMLVDKGVLEFVDAARALSREGVRARFALVGDSDPGNPAAVPPATLEQLQREGAIEWWGFREDMPAVLREASLVCLPSYREGLPKALLEAAASGRAIVATDVPGCREVVREGENGLLVPARDSKALAAALRKLLLDPALLERMGARGRALAEAEFSLERVVAETLDVYRELLEASRST